MQQSLNMQEFTAPVVPSLSILYASLVTAALQDVLQTCRIDAVTSCRKFATVAAVSVDMLSASYVCIFKLTV
jgi:uncharacterized protein YqgC (DUF456 family)